MSDIDLSNIISVSISGAPSGLQTPNINTIALISSEAPLVAWTEDYRVYRSAAAVATDFGSGSDAYALAAAIFSQTPNPTLTQGYVVIVPLEDGETVKEAIERVEEQVYFRGVIVDASIADGELATLTTAIQARRKMLFYGFSDASKYAPAGALDLVRSGGKTNTRGLFHSTQPFKFAAAYAGRLMSTDFGGSRTTVTMNLKPLSTINVDPSMTETEYLKAKAAGVDVYASVAGIAGVLSSGENNFADQIYNRQWIADAIEVAMFNVLRQTNYKVAQDEEGMSALKNAVRGVMETAVANYFVGPGEWTSPDKFGNPEDLVNAVRSQGYYVHSLPVARQLQSDREDRKAPIIQVAAKERGAIHSANLIVNVNA